MHKQRRPRGTPLADTEMSVLLRMVRGDTSAEIASELGMTKPAVDYLCERICEKLGARNRVHAVTIALRRGYVPLYGGDVAP
jgi:DNA-binding CsgD family transcriptional regulator